MPEVVPFDLEDTDPIPLVLPYLRASTALAAALGGQGRISGEYEAPWPHLRVTYGPGSSLGDGRWIAYPEVYLEAYGHPDGSTSEGLLRRALVIAVRVLRDLPDEAPVPGEPVVSYARPTSGPSNASLTNGQPKWTASVVLTVHPSTRVPAE